MFFNFKNFNYQGTSTSIFNRFYSESYYFQIKIKCIYLKNIEEKYLKSTKEIYKLIDIGQFIIKWD